eukprot:m.199310 g.199310  ORF g.199310 m.199310 type:complete len:67 (+) comp39567_c0_seq43:308-508(+)
MGENSSSESESQADNVAEEADGDPKQGKGGTCRKGDVVTQIRLPQKPLRIHNSARKGEESAEEIQS